MSVPVTPEPVEPVCTHPLALRHYDAPEPEVGFRGAYFCEGCGADLTNFVEEED